MFGVFETKKLILRPFQDEDIDPLYEIQSNQKAMRYTYCSHNRDDTKSRMRAYAALSEQVGYAPWTAILKSKQKIVGWGGLNIDPFDSGWGTEVAYFFHPDYWGQGLATELVMASLKLGFTDLNLEIIGAFAHRDNTSSIHVLTKIGFEFLKYEPVLDRNHYEIRKIN